MTTADELRDVVAKNRRALRGEDGSIGLVDRIGVLEEWQNAIDRERTFYKALIIGMLLGLGLNGAGIIAILSRLTGG